MKRFFKTHQMDSSSHHPSKLANSMNIRVSWFNHEVVSPEMTQSAELQTAPKGFIFFPTKMNTSMALATINSHWSGFYSVNQSLNTSVVHASIMCVK